MIYILPGNPIPLARPRFGQNRIFDSQKLLKINHGILLKQLHGKKPPLKGPLDVDITFFLPIPLTMSKKKKKLFSGTTHTKRPDIDNLIKYILDTSNKIIFADDCLIAILKAKKIYDPNPRTELIIKEIHEEH